MSLALVMAYAQSLIGVPYKWGGNNPVEGLDCCLAAGTLILTKRGWVKIEEVTSSDLVASYSENGIVWSRVVGLHKNGPKKVYRIQAGGNVVYATGNHRFLAYSSFGPPGWARVSNASIAWKNLEDLGRGDLIAKYTAPQPDSASSVDLDNETLYFLGAFQGDGSFHTDHRGIGIAFCSEQKKAKIPRLIAAAERLGFTGKPGLIPSHGVTFNSRLIHDFVAMWLGRNESSGREYRPWMSQLSGEQFQSFLSGYLDADGHFSSRAVKGDAYAVHSTAENWIRALHAEMSLRGYRPTVLSMMNRSKLPVIKGKQVRSAKPLYLFSFVPNRPQDLATARKKSALLPQGFDLFKIRTIEEAGVMETFDLTIANTHSYICAGGLVVHNSGYAMELLRASGEIDNPSLDLTAQEIYDHLVARGGSVGVYSAGTFAFYGESVTKITHVAFMVSPYQIIEAGGGGHKTLSVEDAAKNNAFVRLRDIKYRKDGLVATVKPRYASIGYFP